MKLLIAEDDVTLRHILEAVTRKWGYDPVAVEDGETAWQILQGPDPPRLLLLDWMMPGVDGLTLCRRIRQHESERNPNHRSPPPVLVAVRRLATPVHRRCPRSPL